MWINSLQIVFAFLVPLAQCGGNTKGNETDLSVGAEMSFIVRNLTSFPTSTANLSIIDIVLNNPAANSTIVKRRLLNADRQEITITEIDLLSSNETEIEKMDTTKLPVDYSKVHPGLRPLIASPFAVGSLPWSKEKSSNVLIVGLGGALLNNFLHFTFPKMNITVIELESTIIKMAEQYFGLKQDKYHKVLNADGVDYIEGAAKKGQKFDVVIIDACPTVYPLQNIILCPSQSFISDKTIENIKRILSKQGSVVVKMLLYTDNVQKQAEEIGSRFAKSHLTCSILAMINPYNRVLICGNEGVSKAKMGIESIRKQSEKFYKQYNLPVNQI